VAEVIDFDRFLNAYFKEIDFFYSKVGRVKVETIFFGGGTPSLMSPDFIEKILEKVFDIFLVDENCEITLEANPTSFEVNKFKVFRSIGINRLSLGVQSLNDKNLKFLGRNHSKNSAIFAIEKTSEIFDNFSFDLIYALPNQSIKSWLAELKTAIKFNTKHLSLYQLTIEKGTKFFSDVLNKKFEMPDEDLSAKFYEMTGETAKVNGFEDYEISNYAKKKFQCKHNLGYWTGSDYMGVGAGAHSRIYFGDKRYAIMMTNNPAKWLETVEKSRSGIQTIENIKDEEILEELILMGLRLKNGINDEIFYRHFKKNLAEIFDFERLKTLENQGLVELSTSSIKIPDKKRILTNSIILKVLKLGIIKTTASWQKKT
jgi:oxygen-independent coproporphyrinogen-3 oxidase